jgi:predicted small integral membrane protein
MTLRTVKVLLVFAVAFYYTLVVFNNLTDYNSNYQFVQHTMTMDTTFPGNHGMWRAIRSPAMHTTFYLIIIVLETLTMFLCWWGGVRMAQEWKASAAAFHQSKRVAILGLTLSLLTWLVVFLSIGGEWFLMWQSKSWNGQDAAFRMFTIIGIVLVLVAQPDGQDQP